VKGMAVVSGLATLCALVGLGHLSDVTQAIAALCVAAFFLMWGGLCWSLPSLLAAPRRAASDSSAR